MIVIKDSRTTYTTRLRLETVPPDISNQTGRGVYYIYQNDPAAFEEISRRSDAPVARLRALVGDPSAAVEMTIDFDRAENALFAVYETKSRKTTEIRS